MSLKILQKNGIFVESNSIRQMNKNCKSQHRVGYESPYSEILTLESRNIICTSGQLDDYNVDDFDWEGTGNE